MTTKNLLAGMFAVALASSVLARDAHAQQGATGVDVSKYQGSIDWNAAAGSGLSFAIARVSDGLNNPDAYFAQNWSGMQQAGLVRGVYQFFRPTQDAVGQADLLVNAVGQLASGDLPPFLDLEVTDGADSGTIQAGVNAWCAEIQSRLGVTPLIYCSPGFWNGLGISPPPGVELWVANWQVSAPQVPSGWSNWTFWQFTDSYSVSGIGSNGDGNVFNGTTSDLLAWAASHGVGGAPPVQTPQAPPPQSSPATSSVLQAIIDKANEIDSHHYPYLWGGGHDSNFTPPYDCSGAVSAVLNAAGLLSSPHVSGWFMSYGDPGPGTVTIYAKNGHVYMSIQGQFFGTSSQNSGGGAGWFNGYARSGFVQRHVPESLLGTASGTTSTPTASSSGTTTTSYPMLSEGATGSDVVTLQDDLTAKGFSPGASDGIFGPLTQQAVLSFQSASGLIPDGIVGPLTWSALTQ